MPSIIDIQGIGAAYAEKFRAAGVRSTKALLAKGGTPAGRKELATATGFTTKQILEWVNRADLYRVKGVGSQYSDLLEAAGVDTVMELGNRKADALLATMTAANQKKNLVNKLPVLSQVSGWIKAAKALKRAVEY